MTALWIILLFVGGMGLILCEFIIPGGIVGTLGVCMVVGSAALGMYSYPDYWVFILVGEAVGAVICFVIGYNVIARTGLGRAMILADAQEKHTGYVSDESDKALVGKLGEAFTPLRPAGTIMVQDNRMGAVSSGDFIEQGALVRIIEVHGNRVVVELADGEVSTQEA
jgi:membrane-bound serine protease (ClpP class)